MQCVETIGLRQTLGILGRTYFPIYSQTPFFAVSDQTPTSSKLLLIMLGGTAVLFIVLALFLATDRPEGDTGAGAVQTAPEQQVESEDTGMPVTPHRPDSLLADPPVNQDAPVDEEPLYRD